jgi:hypothetical protein
MIQVGHPDAPQAPKVSAPATRIIRFGTVERIAPGRNDSDNNVRISEGDNVMKTVKFDGEIGTFNGKAIKPVLPFQGTYDAFGPDKPEKQYTDADWDAAATEMKEKNEYPTTKDIVQFVNDARKTSARAKAGQAALDLAGYEKPTLENDEDLQLKTVIKSLLARKNPDGTPKHTQESALAAAKAALDIE